MLKNSSVIIVLGFLILCCNDKVNIEKPDNLISKDKMSDILYDLYVINSAKGVNRKVLEANDVVPETYVLNKYSIDSTQFADSNTYYAFKTEDYNAIVDRVKRRLEKDKEKYEAIKEIEADSLVRIKDSIRKSRIKPKVTIKKDFDSMQRLKQYEKRKTLDTLKPN